MSKHSDSKKAKRLRHAGHRIEPLERRQLLSAVSWIGTTDGDWSNTANWSTGAVPGAGDDVTINAPPGVFVSVTNETEAANSVTTSSNLFIQSGGTLAVGTGIALQGSAILAVGGATEATLLLNGSGPESISGTGSVIIGEDSEDDEPGQLLLGGNTLTIGSGVSLDGVDGELDAQSAGGTIIDDGSFLALGGAESGNQSFNVGQSYGNIDFQNDGTMTIANGVGVQIDGQFTAESGSTISVLAGATLPPFEGGALNGSVDSLITLGGTLNIAPNEGFTPTAGYTYPVVESATSTAGAFATTTGLTQSNYVFTLNTNGAAITLAVATTASQLAFSIQPVDASTGGILTAVTVNVEDSNGDLVTSDDSNVTLALSNGGTLGGTTTVAAVDGVATFSDLSIATAGTYTLTATDGTDTAATSNSFDVLAPAGSGTDVFTLSSADLAANNLYVDYTWPSTQADLDTGTEFLGKEVGFGADDSDTYLTFSGDDTSAGGSESSVINLNQSHKDGAWSGSTQVLAHAGWYDGAGGSGPATITVALINATTGALTEEHTQTINPGRQDDLATTLVDTITINLNAAIVKTIGGLDPSFGNGGLASHDVGFTSTGGLAQDGTQSVLVGSIGTAPGRLLGVTRYNGDGSLDTTFGTSGVTSIAFGSTDAAASAVDVLPSGNILVAGTATTYTDGTAGGSEFAVAELNANGSLDTGFGIGGEALISYSATADVFTNDVLNAMAVATNGTIYLGGSSDAAGKGNTDFAVAALTASGSIDTGFGGGKALLDFGGGDDVIHGLALQTNGDLVAAGSASIGGVTEIALTRFLFTGVVDARFGVKGKVTTNVRGVYDSAASVVIQPKGQIVLGGLSATGTGASLSTDFVVQRYTSTGKLDRTFGGTGSVITSFGQPSAITQVLLQPNGEIIASGKTATSLTDIVADNLNVTLARYSTKGVLDTSFSGTGKTVISLSAGVVGTNEIQTVGISDLNIQPLDSPVLDTDINAITSADQGVTSMTPGGEILDGGNSGDNTVEAEVITAGIDLLTKVLSAVPASVLGGIKGTASVQITEVGTTQAIGVITLEIEFSTDTEGDGGVTAKSLPEHISLKQGQSKPYKVSFSYPSGLTSGGYYLVAVVVDPTTLTDLNPTNNVAPSGTAVTIAPPTITLAGSGLTVTKALDPGKSAGVLFDLINNGNVLAKGKIEVELLLSYDEDPDDGTSIATEQLSIGLSAGKAHIYKLTFTLPSTITAGNYDLLAVIDPANNLGSDDNSDTTVVDPLLATVG